MGIIPLITPEAELEATQKLMKAAQAAAETASLMHNYWGIVHSPQKPVSAASDALDHGSTHGESIRRLETVDTKNGTVPLHPEPGHPPAEIKSTPQRDLKTLSSDTFDDAVLMSFASESAKWTPEKVIATFGKNAAIGKDKEGKDYVAIMDPGTHDIRAYKILAVERDMHENKDHSLYPNGQTPSADPNGFSAVASAKLRLDPAEVKGKYGSAREFIDAHKEKEPLDAMPKDPNVRTGYGGFQVNVENWSLPGRLDRGEMSKQLSRVTDFNEKVAGAMQAEKMPANTEVSFFAHSLASGSAPFARYEWEHNREFTKLGKAGPVTIAEPVAQEEAVRQVAYLIAAEKNTAALENSKHSGKTPQKTDVETTIRDLTKNTDIVMNGHASGILHDFQVYNASTNNGIVGTRAVEVPFDHTLSARIDDGFAALGGFKKATVALGALNPAFGLTAMGLGGKAELDKMDNHFLMSMAAQMIHEPELRAAPNMHLADPKDVANAVNNNQSKQGLDAVIQTGAYGIASLQTVMTDDFKFGKEEDFRKTATDLAKATGLSQQGVDAVVNAAHVPSNTDNNTELARK